MRIIYVYEANTVRHRAWQAPHTSDQQLHIRETFARYEELVTQGIRDRLAGGHNTVDEVTVAIDGETDFPLGFSVLYAGDELDGSAPPSSPSLLKRVVDAVVEDVINNQLTAWALWRDPPAVACFQCGKPITRDDARFWLEGWVGTYHAPKAVKVTETTLLSFHDACREAFIERVRTQGRA